MEQARDQTHLLEGHHGWIKSGTDLVVAVLLGLSVMAIAWGATDWVKLGLVGVGGVVLLGSLGRFVDLAVG